MAASGQLDELAAALVVAVEPDDAEVLESAVLEDDEPESDVVEPLLELDVLDVLDEPRLSFL